MAPSVNQVLVQLQRWTAAPTADLSDAVLLERYVQQGDQAAFAALVARYGSLVLGVCRRILGANAEVEDAFQAAFVVLARKAATLRQPDALAGWLHCIARRAAWKARRRDKRPARRTTGERPLATDLPDPHPDPLTQLTARELLEIVEREVQRLPLAQRSVVLLCCLQGHSREEAVKRLGWTPGAVKSHLQRGRRRLQERLRRRGIALSAALAIGAVSRGTAASALLLRSTVTVALSGRVDTVASALAHSVLQSMFLGKLTAVMTMVLSLALAASGALALVYRQPAAEVVEDTPPAIPAAPKNARATKPPVRKDFWGDPLPPGAVARMGSLRLYHGAVDVRKVVLSPDGKLVTSSTDKGDNKLWDVQTGRELPLAESLRHAFVFAAKGKLLGAEQQGNRLWDLATGKEVSADGIDIASARKQKDLSRNEKLSPDGTIIAAWDDKGIRLLDARTRKELPPLQGQPKENVWPPCFSPDSKLLAVPCFLRPSGLPGVRLWDLATRKEARWLRGKDYQIFDIAFSGDGKIVAAADGGGVTLWDATAGKWLHDPGHTYYVGALAFTPDGKTLLSGSGYNDRFLRSWDPSTGRPRGKWTGHEWGILAVLITPDGKRVISTSQDNTIRFWDLASGKEIGRLGDKIIAWSAALSPDGKRLATGSQGIQLWDLATRRKVRSFGAGTIGHLAFSPDGAKLTSSASKDKTVRLWNVANGKELRTFTGDADGWTQLGLSPEGQTLATGDRDGVVHLWDVATGKELRRLGQPLKPGPRSAYVLGALTFSPDGRVVAVGYSDQTVRLLEAATGKERARYQGHQAGLYSLAFSPDGRLLASGSWDRTIVVWDVTGRVCLDNLDLIRLDAKAQDQLWADLADSNAAKAYQAMCVLLGAEQTMSLLTKRLHPAAAIDAARLNRLATELDSDDFEVREKATRELAASGDRAEPVLRQAFPKTSAEARRRITDILARIDPASSAELLRGLRAVEVLEGLGTAEAQRMLKDLAGGDAQARLTREAKAALARLANGRR